MQLVMRPGPAAGLVEDALADAEGRGLVGHVRAGDPAAWGAHADAARDWTGWIGAPEAMFKVRPNCHSGRNFQAPNTLITWRWSLGR